MSNIKCETIEQYVNEIARRIEVQYALVGGAILRRTDACERTPSRAGRIGHLHRPAARRWVSQHVELDLYPACAQVSHTPYAMGTPATIGGGTLFFTIYRHGFESESAWVAAVAHAMGRPLEFGERAAEATTGPPQRRPEVTVEAARLPAAALDIQVRMALGVRGVRGDTGPKTLGRRPQADWRLMAWGLSNVTGLEFRVNDDDPDDPFIWQPDMGYSVTRLDEPDTICTIVTSHVRAKGTPKGDS